MLLNVIVKPVWIFAIDRKVQLEVGQIEYGSYFALLNLTIIFSFLMDLGFTTTNGANSFDVTDDGEWVFGAQVGGGAELMLNRNFSIGLEYLYNSYDADEAFVAVGPGTAGPTNPFLLVSGGTNMRPADTQFDFHSLRATASFHF